MANSRTQNPAQTQRFKAEMPQIPGLEQQPGAKPTARASRSFTGLRAILSLVLIGTGLLAWQAVRASRAKARAVAPPDPAAEIAPAAPAPVLAAPIAGPVSVATVQELQTAWSSKEFDFVKPETLATVRSMVVRLPGVAGDHSAAYWAFSLVAPFGNCNLTYIKDLKELAGRYNYAATHPMVVSQCDGTVFDPLRMAMLPSGAYVRGDVVQGPGLRPPISIHVDVKGHEIIADQIE